MLAVFSGLKEIGTAIRRSAAIGIVVLLSPLRTKLIKCQFKAGSDPLWAWVWSVFDRQDAINELMNCV